MLGIKNERGGGNTNLLCKIKGVVHSDVFVAAGMLQFKEGGEKLPSESTNAPRTCLLLSSNAAL